MTLIREHTLDLDSIMEALDRDGLPLMGADEITDERASRMVRKAGELERELGAGRAWWDGRRRSLARAIGWLDDNLETWALRTHAATGLKTFPCGEGVARVQKARAKVEWGDGADAWLRPLAARYPELVKELDLGAVVDRFVDWSKPDGNGVCTAVDKVTGEVLPGLLKDTRPGALSCSVKPGRAS